MKVEISPVDRDSVNAMTTTTQVEPVSINPIQRRPVASQSSAVSSNNSDDDGSQVPPYSEMASSYTPAASSVDGSEIHTQTFSIVGEESTLPSYYQDLPPEQARCTLLPGRAAAWSVRDKENIKLCILSAAVLLEAHILTLQDLILYSPDDQNSNVHGYEPTDPISGVLSATHRTVGGVILGLADYPITISQMIKEDRPAAQNRAVEFSLDRGKGVSRILGTGLRAPMDVTLGLARGFKNLPKAYGDESVRETERITGLGSGLKVAGKGFGLGLYDGISGFFVQPVQGAKKGGAIGLLTGIGKGVGGIVCKPAAGVCGLPAYAFKGLYEEVHKKRGSNRETHVRELLIDEGIAEWQVTTDADRKAIIDMWTHTKDAGEQEQQVSIGG